MIEEQNRKSLHAKAQKHKDNIIKNTARKIKKIGHKRTNSLAKTARTQGMTRSNTGLNFYSPEESMVVSTNSILRDLRE